MNAARIAGPVLAGLLIASIGIGPCFLANAVSYAAVVAAFLAMRPRDLFPTERVPRGGRLIDVATQILPFIGYPRTLNALRAIDEVVPA